MKFVPHDYQRHAIDFIVRNPSAGLFLDMGLGKTVITLTAINDLMFDKFLVKRALVIAPLATAQNTWSAEVSKWDHLKHMKVAKVLGDADTRMNALRENADVYVINRENVVWLCEYLGDAWPFDMVVIDELSSFKSPKAKRFKALRKMIPFAQRVVGLTGTPAPNGYMDLWSEIYLLDRGRRLGRTISAYRDAFFKPGRRNGHVVYDWVLLPFSKEAIDEKLEDLCISMKAEDWLTMPDRVDTEVYVTMTPEERAAYDKFGREHVLRTEEGIIVGLTAATVQNKLLQMANGFAYDENGNPIQIHEEKLTALEELVEAAGGRSILCFYSFVEDKKRILNKFPQAKEFAPDMVDDWNTGKIKLLLAHPASAGHGLNLQAGGNIIVWYGLPWSLELYEQANARLHRQGQKETVFVYHVLTKDTHDEDVLVALRRKTTTQEALLAALKARIGGWDGGH